MCTLPELPVCLVTFFPVYTPGLLPPSYLTVSKGRSRWIVGAVLVWTHRDDACELGAALMAATDRVAGEHALFG